MVPAYGSPSPARMRMVVVLPAPLRPTSPMRSPGWTRSAAPSVESSVRAPARTSRSVAVIRLHSYWSSLLVVCEDRGPRLGARGDRFFEVGGEQAHEELSQALGLHVPLQTSGVQSTPQCALGQLDSRPGERRHPLGQLVARVEQVVLRYGPRDKADAFGFVGVDDAAGEHQLESPRRADGGREQKGKTQPTGGPAPR